ncbi:ABC transporter permease [Paenibacillus nasutitermitis]|uniref:Multiple-sugar transport system permease YteP n=1 Tax=Paenibacillus nasutitermitis TaxID=1652958 RepID=A0A917DRE8_9BACL|nr:ABC transporter permease subunit [Paenibacillus nasutitermitis]GGD59493.1 putative multiple-sugar transport system permease YteP [Paenibacillus nasutitermitis]
MKPALDKLPPTRSRQSYWSRLWSDIWREWDLYILLVPGILFILLFKYTPMYGIVIAFKDFNIFTGFADSPWVGGKHFEKLFTSPDFALVFKNTVIISLLKIGILFPLPIIVALMLNEMRHLLFKRTIQTVIYLPHFLSWVIVSGLFIDLLSTNGGLVNKLLAAMNHGPISFFLDNSIFRSVLITSAGWKETGWSTIVYLAAFSNIDPMLYEASKIDGAGRMKQLWHITLPGIAPIIILMFILRLGSILEAGTEQILVMYNPVVYKVSDVIGSYVYRMGLGNQDYSFSTAVGMFEAVISFTLVITGNALSRKYLQRGIW